MIDQYWTIEDMEIYFDPAEYGYTLSIQGNVDKARSRLTTLGIFYEDLDDQLLVEFSDLIKILAL